ncbi:MAG TPA: cytochrome c biogenesis protein CcsA, partial [Firmicutes bacterium]|nr:cytochrome c biogenesis protein CcsA [Bacillota bacterium]
MKINMVGLGAGALTLALFTGVYAVYLGIRGIKNQKKSLLNNSRLATSASTLFVFLAVLILVTAFLADDFRFSYVARNSERRLPVIFKISALWAGQAGSLLLWLFLLSILAVLVHRQEKYREGYLDIKTVAVIHVLRILFLILLLFVTKPFEKTAALPGDGFGLNPMLQSLGMIVHPPILFLGFSGFIVPFAFTAVEFLARKKSIKWLQFSRPWVLFSWAMLTVGIITGGQWAYNELGWGGYWAWDPVENASLLPWLTATALLHFLRLSPRKKSTKVWSFSLIMLTFLLTIFGTFLTRSGILDSVHAFASGAVGYFFLAVLAVLTLFSLYLGFSRAALFTEEEAAGKNKINWLSKEGGIVGGSVLLLLIFAGVFFGTMFPLFSRWFLGREMVLDESFFNRLTVPLFLPLFLILALSPAAGWLG